MNFWKATGTRALRTFAQSLLALAAGNAMNLYQMGWRTVLATGAGTALLSVLTSIVTGLPETPAKGTGAT